VERDLGVKALDHHPSFGFDWEQIPFPNNTKITMHTKQNKKQAH